MTTIEASMERTRTVGEHRIAYRAREGVWRCRRCGQTMMACGCFRSLTCKSEDAHVTRESVVPEHDGPGNGLCEVHRQPCVENSA